MKIERAVVDGRARNVRFTMTWPDDWHLHVRDGPAMGDVVGYSAHQFRRATMMPNLRPPVTTVALAAAYKKRIMAALPPNSRFEPLMTLYLTDNTSPDEIDRAKESGIVFAVKYYPAGATTNSDSGVTDIKKAYRVLERMQKVGMVLCFHGEVTDPDVDIFDREKVFIDQVLIPTLRLFPGLRVVFEHVTTREAVQYVATSEYDIGATMTPHHLLGNRNAIFAGGIRPHEYCLPILKREEHRQALLAAATSGSRKFFLGTDGAPHARHTKEAACGCAGIFNAWGVLGLYAEAYESVGKLHELEGSASYHGADFYRLPRNVGTVTLVREDCLVPEVLPFGEDELVPYRAGKMVEWRME